MEFRPGQPDPRQETAFEAANVISMVDKLLQNRSLALLKLAKTAILWKARADEKVVAGLLGMAAKDDPIIETTGRAIVEVGLLIAGEADSDVRQRQRSAMLERLVYCLVRERVPRARREEEVRLTVNPRTGKAWSYPKDVLADLHGTFEVYECKLSGRVDQGDVDELADIADTAAAEGRDARPTVALLEAETTFRQRVSRLNVERAFFFAAEEDLFDLALAPSSRTVD